MTRVAALIAFGAELRRRRVFRVALMYAGVAWAIAEVSATFFPPLGIPDWAISLVVMLLVLGFPVALVLAWAFDLTPEGVVRTPPAPAPDVVRTSPAPPAGVGGPAILALPLVDRSAGGGHQYLGDGITEELISGLARLKGLRVVSRTSAFSLRDHGLDVRAIGAPLGVTHVVEGSVRVAEQRLRITVQLVEVAHGYAVWSRTFNRTLEDVFCVQEEIARALVDALRPQLLEGDVGAAAPPALLRPSTSDFEAYALYLRGRQRWNERTPQSLRDALGFFGAAVERDPGYAHAHAGTADGWAILVDHGIIAPAEGLPRAERAAAAALELRPDLAEAHASAGLIAQLQGRHGDAETAFRTALAADPGCLAARQRLALLLAWCGRFAEARAEMQQARLADPLSPLIAASRGWVEYFAGRYEDAIAIARRVIEGEPDFAPARIPLALSLAAAGRCEEAVGEARTCAAELATAPVLGVLAYVLGRCGHADEAADVIERIDALSQETYVGRHVLAQAWSGLRRERETLAELEAARRAAEPQLNYVTVDPMLEWLGDRPALAG